MFELGCDEQQEPITFNALIMTYRERLIAGLKNLGWGVDEADKSKYTAFRKQGKQVRLFVGKMGALRAGRTASSSHSIGDPSNQTGKYLAILQASASKAQAAELDKALE